MSLLDDVSIVVTPNGYKAGTLYSVLPTAIAGSEIVQDSNFTLTGTQAQNTAGTYWVTYAGWTISGGKALRSGVSGNSPIAQNVPVVNGKVYKFSYTRTYASGNGETNLFVQTDGSNYVTLGSYSSTVVEEHTVTGTFVAGFTGNIFWQLYGIGTFTGTVDNVSVKEWSGADMDVTRATAATRVDENGLVNYAQVVGSEVVINGDFDTDSNWAKGANTTISGGKLNSNSAGVYVIASQVPSPYIFQNKVYKYSVTYTITSGSVRLGDSNQVWAGSTQSTSGTYTNIVTSSSVANGQIYFTSPSSDFVGSIDNVSVKETDLNNVPRIDYTGGGCPHILSEPQRTNLVTYSEDFGQWNKIGITVTSNSLISPDGTQNAGKLVATSGASNKIIYQSISANTYTASVFAKKGEFEGLLIATGTTGAFFNLNTNTYRTHYTSPPTSYKIENYGNGWYRYSITFTQSSSDNLYIGVNDNVSTTFAITGNGTSGIYTFGAQLEAGSYPTSYIPTSGSSVTRNQDQFTRDGISSLINSTEGVLFAEISALADDGTSKRITISDGTLVNRITLTLGDNNISGFVNVGSSTQYSFFESGITTTDFNKIAIKYKANDFSVWINGVEYDVQTSGSTFSSNTLNRLNFSNATNLSDFFFGKVKQLQVYKTALTDTQLAALTS